MALVGTGAETQPAPQPPPLDLPALDLPPPPTTADGLQAPLPRLAPGLAQPGQPPLPALLPSLTPDERLVASTKQDDWLAAGLQQLREERATQRENAQARRNSAVSPFPLLPGLGAALPAFAPSRRPAVQPTPAPNPYLAPPPPQVARPQSVNAPTPAPRLATPLPTATPPPARQPGPDHAEEEKYFRQLQRF